MSSEISTEELCNRYSDLYTGVIADVLDGYGFEDQTLDRRIHPVKPSMSMAGIAYPALGRANRSVDPHEQIERFLTMLGSVPGDGVLMLAANDVNSSHVGELTTLALKKRGGRGIVVDGGARDTEFILDQGFPTFTRFKTPADSVPRWELLDWGTSALIGGVSVDPGDIVVGDVDGVTVVPKDVAEDVLLEAESERETEDEVRAAIREGVSPLKAYREHGTF